MSLDTAVLKRHPRLPEPKLSPSDTALLVVDMQYGDAHRDFGLLKCMIDRGDGDAAQYYFQRVEDLVIPNIQRLQHTCRALGIEVIHTKIESLTQDGRDRSLEHRSLGIHYPPGSKEAQILESVGPSGDEIVITKTCSGVFNGTNIEYVLRNLKIVNLIVVGVVTSACVEVAVRDASDRSFTVILVEDACASWSRDMEDAAIRAMNETYAKVKTTDEVIEKLNAIVTRAR